MLRRLFNLAERDQVTRHQPVPRNTLLRENNKRRRFLQDGELDRLRERCDPDFWRMIEVALLTGLRRAELCRLEWRDLDLARGLFRVRASKRHEDEWLPLHPRAVEVLSHVRPSAPQKGERVFPGRAPNAVTKRFQGLCRKAGVEGLHFHDLRHTFCTWLRMAGVPRETIQELARHESPEMTDRYAHFSTPLLREALGRIGNYFGKCPDGGRKYPGRHEVSVLGGSLESCAARHEGSNPSSRTNKESPAATGLSTWMGEMAAARGSLCVGLDAHVGE